MVRISGGFYNQINIFHYLCGQNALFPDFNIMWKKFLNIFKYFIFLGAGIFVFWWVYKDEPLDKYKGAFQHLNYFWILVSIFFSVLSQISRAMRWNMLIRPLGYNPKLYNSYLSVLILYFVNLLLPRAGEVFQVHYT